ncbi:MAG TPA: zf-HC2 domain-containing protein [Gemmatimonadaceae bacterium]
MQHLDEGTIHSWLDGALSADDVARAEAHVKECPQCAAAVAEARGFIAASSRILTALDNVPRNVVPAAAPRRRVDPIVWRVAATMLIVAGGTLVVLRANGRKGQPSSSPTSAAMVMQPQAGIAPPAPIVSDTHTVATTELSKKSARRNSENEFSGKAAKPISEPDAYATEKRSAAQTVNPETRESGRQIGVTPPTAGGAGAVRSSAAAPRFALPRVNSVAAMDAAADQASVRDQPSVRVVGTPRALGESRTLYEVSPGDTVLLAEVLKLSLESVVVTGAAATTPRTDSRRAGVTAPQAAVAEANVPAPTAQTINGVTTLTWTDPATGSTMKLSGRHTREELLEIKRRIEQAKAAAADAKKNR